MFKNTVKPGDSISLQLIRVVFAFYCVIAVLVTGFHIIVEYRHTKSIIHDELKTNEDIFGQVLSSALWDLDKERIQRILQAMYKLPTTIGIRIDQNNELFMAIGTVQGSDRTVGYYDIHGNYDDSRDYLSELFSYSFPVVYEIHDQTNKIGQVTVFSDSSVVIDRIGLGLVMLVFNAMIKTLALWLIFIWVGKRILIKPLSALTDAISSVDFDKLDDFNIHLETRKGNELDVIEKKFEGMVEKLGAARKDLLELNNDLEKKVALRTQDLEAAKNQAEQANSAKSYFMSRISHELRTPLNAIIGFSKRQIKISDDSSSDKIHYMAERINKAGYYLLMLINDIIDFVDYEKGKIPIRAQRCMLSESVKDSLSIVSSFAADRGISLEDNTADADIFVDPGRLTQVIINVLTNGVKYNRTGGSVTLSCVPQEKFLHLNITDTGVGIPEKERDKVFKPFVRLDYAEAQAIEGTGIGLTLSQQLIRGMGGDLDFESTPGEGTTFTLKIPRYIETIKHERIQSET
ncbi:sensor histidine kinase [Teredinibacter sp. KSP-S5-2]|uniref:sensor histidine kinase n=1 Tax=Teredinibacter sp. KSP-S5-2 TaxID=3034506 RepID=UPI0029350972|nr:ATP-binding protein [Teredinibacter sp. KSP-S5-2]WNO10676.1 ATP-binding protein [Teredinibacter sp. KSP-S5-2]